MFHVQGSSPPQSIRDSRRSNAIESNATFGQSLRISSGECSDGIMEDMIEPSHEHSASRPLRRRREGPELSVTDTLQGKGMPSSICRLIADMLENDNHHDEMGSLFCNDQAISTFKDVVSDLKQMVDNPKSFLHDSLLMRWKPVLAANKLYCRDGELTQALGVADRVVSQCGGNKAMEETLEYSPRSQEVLMISGHSGKIDIFSAHDVLSIGPKAQHHESFSLSGNDVLQEVGRAVLCES